MVDTVRYLSDASNSSEDKAHNVRALLSSAPSKVLDFGSGNGQFATALRKIYPETTIVMTDLPEQGPHNGLDYESVNADSTLRFEDNSFDVVVAMMVLHHVVDIETTCKEIFRVLRPGGKLVVREHDFSVNQDFSHHRTLRHIMDYLDVVHDSFNDEMPVIRYYSARTLALIFEGVGLDLKTLQLYPDHIQNPQHVYHSLYERF